MLEKLPAKISTIFQVFYPVVTGLKNDLSGVREQPSVPDAEGDSDSTTDEESESSEKGGDDQPQSKDDPKKDLHNTRPRDESPNSRKVKLIL